MDLKPISTKEELDEFEKHNQEAFEARLNELSSQGKEENDFQIEKEKEMEAENEAFDNMERA